MNRVKTFFKCLVGHMSHNDGHYVYYCREISQAPLTQHIMSYTKVVGGYCFQWYYFGGSIVREEKESW